MTSELSQLLWQIWQPLLLTLVVSNPFWHLDPKIEELLQLKVIVNLEFQPGRFSDFPHKSSMNDPAIKMSQLTKYSH